MSPRAWVGAFSCIAAVLGCSTAAGKPAPRLVVATAVPPAARVALAELERAVAAHGVTLHAAAALPTPDEPSIVIGAAGGADAFTTLLEGAGIKVPAPAESSVVTWLAGRAPTLVIAGRDERGLTYALRDAARGILIAATTRRGDWTAGVTPAVESPFLRVRGVSLHLFNADCEREWFFNEDFWKFYFSRLSCDRFNRCTITFCDQTNYLCPPYAYLVAMPEYPQVRVKDCTAAQREANLAMLRRISELADEHAIDLDLGIWMQAPVEKWAAPVKVTGLPEGQELAAYCALGLRRIYEACPSLDGIQLRMNAEAGVSEDTQTDFYRPLFAALAAVGRRLRVELRLKGLRRETIDAAVAAGLDVTVSTKFWAEHFGLPFHPTVVDSHYAADRYSFGAMLTRCRHYRVTYQLWTVGSQRLTLWGDPDYAARFARSCTLGGGEGFEVFAPLTNKGYGNEPGAWRVIANPEYRVGRWEQDRYWMFYLCFGRMGYNPATNPEIWKREFRQRFGAARAERVEAAYRSASRVLPLITAALLPGASEYGWWPEMDTGGGLAEYSRIQPGDPGQFAPILAWKKTPEWRLEEWDERPGSEDAPPDRRADGRTGPATMSRLLEEAARGIRVADLAEASDSRDGDPAEWRITGVDFRLLAALASYHASKLQAATWHARFEKVPSMVAWTRMREAMTDARRHWQEIVAATEGVYHENLVFGVSPGNARNTFGHHHSGHWRDRCAENEDALARIDRLESAALASPPDAASGPGGEPAAFPGVRHAPPRSVPTRTATTLRIDQPAVGVQDRIAAAVLHVRPLDQTRAWKTMPMTRDADGTFVVELSADDVDPEHDVQYFFELHDGHGRAGLWPDWRIESPYFVVPVDTHGTTPDDPRPH